MRNIRWMAVVGLQCGGFILAQAPSVAFALAPNVSVSYEPVEGGSVRVLPMAPRIASESVKNQLSLAWAMTNNQASAVTMTQLVVDFPGSSVAGETITATVNLAGPGSVSRWNFVTAQNLILPDPPPATIRLRLFFSGYSTPLIATYPLAAYQAPTPSGSTRFWGRVGDLRPREFWQAMGASHSASLQGCQLFAHDVGVYGWNGTSFSDLIPGTNGTQNQHYRQWGKPIFAVSAGKVKAFINTIPDNVPNGTIPPGVHGGGNQFVIDNGTYAVSYNHMQAGSLNPELLAIDADVSEGEFLGLVGSSGESPSKPHLHIGAVKSNASTTLWTECGGPLRPMPLDSAHAIDLTALSGFQSNASLAPWSGLAAEGIPNGASGVNSLIWPSDTWPADLLQDAVLSDFAIGTNGQLWTVESTGSFRTTSDRLKTAYDTGVYLDTDPGGSGKAIAFSATTPYAIGTNDRVYRGTSSGWVLTSQVAKQITVDQSTGKVWAIGFDNAIYSFSPSTLTWSAELPTTATAKDIAVANGVSYIIGLDDHVWKAGGGTYTQLSATVTLKRLAVDGSSGKLWGIGMDDGIYSSPTGSTWTKYSPTSTGQDVRVFGGVPYILGMDGGVWKGTGSSFVRINVVEP